MDTYSCKDFFESVFGHELIKNYYMYTWSPGHRGGCTISHKCSDVSKIISRVADRNDAYFGMALTHRPLTINERAKAKDIDGITCLWLDVDFESPYRHKENLPRNINNIKPILDSMPPATWWIDSGYGFHCYWVFDEPYLVRTGLDRDTINLTVKRWNTIFKRKFKEFGYELDSTSSAQVLRVPGTFNTKDPTSPKRVEVVSFANETHAFDDLFEITYTLAGDIKTADAIHLTHAFEFEINPNALVTLPELELINEAIPNFNATWTGKKAYPSQSERDMAIATMLKAAGMSDQTIVNAMIQNRRELDSNMFGKVDKNKLRADYFQRTLTKAAESELVKKTMFDVELIASANSNPSTNSAVATEEPGVVEEPDGPLTPLLETARAKMEEVMGIYVKRLLKIKSSPPSYRLSFSIGPIHAELTFPTIKDLTSQKYFRERIMEVTNVYATQVKGKKWDEFMGLLLPFAEDEELVEGGTENEEFKIKVNMFLDARGCVLEEEGGLSHDELKAADAFYRIRTGEDVDVYIRPMAFMSWHNREGFPERLNTRQISVLMFNIGGKPSKNRGVTAVKLKGKLVGSNSVEV